LFNFKNKENNNLKEIDLKSKKTVDDFLKPKKNKYKPYLIIAGVIVLFFAIWLGANTYKAYSKIINKNTGKSAPFLSFMDNVSPDKLQGEGDGRINILLLGLGGEEHPGGNLTDTIQVVSIDPNNKKIAALSIPRDMYVDLPIYSGTKINEVYSYGEANKEETGGGPQFIKDVISQILDLPIHYYVKMDFEGFKKIIDEVGGVDVVVEEELYDPYYPAEDMIGYEPFYIDAGAQHLDGTDALKYARSRETTSDFDRSKRQQQILMALKDKIMSLGVIANPTKINGIMEVLGDHLRTDLQLKEIERLATLLKDINKDSMLSKVIDNSAEGPLTSSSEGGYFLVTKTGDYKDVQRIAHELFTDPYLKKENAKIEVLNGSNQAGLGQEASDTLTSYGYNIINLDKSDEILQKTTIYDYTNNKYPFTLKFLTDRYDAKVIQKTPPANSNIDMTLIIGNDMIE